VRRLLGLLLVLAALLVGVDRVAAHLVTGQIERRARAEIGEPVEAVVHGVPFLTQTLRHRLDHVELRAAGARLSGTLEVRDLRADLQGVRVPGAGEVTAADFLATGVVPFREIERRVDLAPGALSAAPDGRLRVTRRVGVLGRVVDVAGLTELRVEGGRLVGVPGGLEVEGSRLPLDEGIRRGLGRALRFEIDLSATPPGTRVAEVHVAAGGLAVRLAGTDVALEDL
jgi:hypothetical protein